ncbi:hypothetical protein P0Y31_05380 [Knoellia sp. 3-2P3]|uniref:tetratricopeptide repeat protein n=1 Tax=unclassified Knoellia TaxID=2618719 RepID=UPI0023DB27FC|nr:tetratricopeptide repeat protein [Knoellia sp. 3-2P3]MDF2091765.1 hypothetical protein [Knoellia sp. 3-2P3]
MPENQPGRRDDAQGRPPRGGGRAGSARGGAAGRGGSSAGRGGGSYRGRDGDQPGARRGGAGAGGAGGERSGDGRRAGAPRGGSARGGAPRGDARDGGQRGARPVGTFDNSERRGGSRLAPKSPRLPDPRIAEGVTGKELDRSVHQQLRTLSKENAEGVAQHLVMVAAMLEADDIAGAEAHAETAVRRAGRVPAAREALGLVAYRKGEWARALSEFRTARRLSGSSHMLPLMVDCERGLGRPERALELATSPEARTLTLEERIELAIVISGIRRDLGQPDAAVLALQIPQLKSASRKPWSARLAYAYADALLETGDEGRARDWFARAADFDDEGETDAADRLAELDGVVLVDLLEGEDDEAETGLEAEDDAREGRTPRGGTADERG